VRRHLGCPYANKNVFSNRGIRQAQCLAVAVPAASVPDMAEVAAGKLRSPKRVRVLGTMHVSTSAELRRRQNLAKPPDRIYGLQVRGSLLWVLWGIRSGGSALLFVGFSVLVGILPRSFSMSGAALSTRLMGALRFWESCS